MKSIVKALIIYIVCLLIALFIKMNIFVQNELNYRLNKQTRINNTLDSIYNVAETIYDGNHIANNSLEDDWYLYEIKKDGLLVITSSKLINDMCLYNYKLDTIKLFNDYNSTDTIKLNINNKNNSIVLIKFNKHDYLSVFNWNIKIN